LNNNSCNDIIPQLISHIDLKHDINSNGDTSTQLNSHIIPKQEINSNGDISPQLINQDPKQDKNNIEEQINQKGINKTEENIILSNDKRDAKEILNVNVVRKTSNCKCSLIWSYK